MKIGIILHPYGEDKPAGLARIIFELAEELIQRYPEEQFTVFLKNKQKNLPCFSGNNWNSEILGGGIFWLDRLRKKPLLDCYIFNTPALPIFWKAPRSIALVLDFAYWYFRPKGTKGFFSTHLTYWYHKFSLKKADRIVSISNATKKDLIALFPAITPEKVKTIYFGFHRISKIPPTSMAVPDRFFLFVGVFKERKNVLNVVRAFELFLKTHPGYTLILAGKAEGEYARKVRDYIRRQGLEHAIIEQGFVSDAELSFLYKHAIALVFPSVIEGFGFPVLEAMDCSLPVITSHTSSLGEVGKDAALLVNPESAEEIARSMARLVENAQLRAELIQKGLKRANDFSWDRTASEVMELIKQK